MFAVFEDNGGGLYLCILQDGCCVEIFEGFEYQGAGALTETIRALQEDPEGWMDWDGSLVDRLRDEGGAVNGASTAEELYDAFYADETCMLVAWDDEDGTVTTDPKHMGAAAQIALEGLVGQEGKRCGAV